MFNRVCAAGFHPPGSLACSARFTFPIIALWGNYIFPEEKMSNILGNPQVLQQAVE
jgi:hypothetical protein